MSNDELFQSVLLVCILFLHNTDFFRKMMIKSSSSSSSFPSCWSSLWIFLAIVIAAASAARGTVHTYSPIITFNLYIFDSTGIDGIDLYRWGDGADVLCMCVWKWSFTVAAKCDEK